MHMIDNMGMVVIGRNEGEQLKRCFQSIVGRTRQIVYVDSGSTDDSVKLARSMGIDVVELDMSIPFTAARARNEGVARLMQLCPDLEYVHTLDGDVEVIDGWFASALEVMKAHPKAAVLSGLRKERYPRASVFNRLCDIEWNKPKGYPACEGDAIMRVAAFKQVGGFDNKLIAGEEPELCLRYWRAGFECLRNTVPMTWHDVHLLHFSQWWKRESRTGYSYAEGAALHGKVHYLRQSLGIWFWGVGVPVASIALACGLSIMLRPMAWGLLGLLLWPMLWGLLFVRVYRGARPRANSNWYCCEYCFFNIITKYPMLAGGIRYWLRRWTGKRSELIEYRKDQPAQPAHSAT
jgi:GT2 family glycosyltransferase